MHLTYNLEAQIQIWRQALPQHPGHVSLELRSANTANRSYISWWPGGEGETFTRHFTRADAKRAELGESARMAFDGYQSVAEAEIAYAVQQLRGWDAFKPKPGQKPLKGSLNNEWGQSPDVKTAIPLLGSVSAGGGKTPCYFGVDGKAIRHWWSTKLAQANAGQTSYKFVSKRDNCSGVVTEALKAGGAAAFAPPPNGLVSTPNLVMNWQGPLSQQIQALNTSFNHALFRITQVQDAPTRQWMTAPVEDVMSLKEWTAAAGKSEGREDTAVDTAMTRYHSIPAWNNLTAAQKLPLTVSLTRTACARVEKAKGGTQLVRGARYYATLQLLHQIGQTLKARGDGPLA